MANESCNKLVVSTEALALASCTVTAWVLRELVEQSILSRDAAIALVERVTSELDAGEEAVVNFEASGIVRAIVLPIVSSAKPQRQGQNGTFTSFNG